MQDVDEYFGKLFDENETFRRMVKETLCFYKGFPEKRLEKTRELMQETEKDKDLKELFAVDKKKEETLFVNVINFLNFVSYKFAPLAPAINEQQAYASAIANPLCFWLYDNVDKLECTIVIAAYLSPKQNGTFANSILRLHELVQRFRQLVHPHMIQMNQKLVEDSKKNYPEFNKMLN